MAPENPTSTRRRFLRESLWGGALAATAAAGAALAARAKGDKLVWQIDPFKCIGCGKCATHCIFNE